MTAKTLAILAAGMIGVTATALAADTAHKRWSFGASQYQARCAPCHGKTGTGDGPAAKNLLNRPPDLTTYAKRNGGKFPTELAWQKIDGRPVSYDKDTQMPVWGRDFRHEAMSMPLPDNPPESYVAAELYAVIEYLKTIQAK
jgi:mono/diheme cytochrome c family protein